MIYLDASVALAHLLLEDRTPPSSLWEAELTSSRLLEYEIWTRLHAKNLGSAHADAARALLTHIELVELTPHVLARAVEPFPVPLRTLDALHLASLEYLRAEGQSVELASYDQRLLAAARALGVGIASLAGS